MQIDNAFLLSDGVQLSYARYGPETGKPAFYFHGLPGSRREGILMHKACLRHGVQLIAVDRPGYGHSELSTESRLEYCPRSIVELAQHLGFTYFYLFAASGGAPYALACASSLQERVLGTGICCGLAEVARPELRDKMAGFARLAFHLTRLNPVLLKYSYGLITAALARLAPRAAIDMLASILSEPDRSLLRQPDIKAIFAANLHEAFRHGPGGALADMCTALEPWPFELSRIGSLSIWHGTRDRVVPLQHSQWLAKNLPNSTLHIIENEGHFSLPVLYADSVIQSVISST